ncbi:MAG: hypothetical protein ACOYIR_08690 [Christensenellales bacterium]|jgi:hypothetical protein
MRAAIIENGVVTNIIISDGYVGAVPTGDLPVAIGDIYDGTDFWRNGEKVVIPQPESEREEGKSE